MTGQPTTPAPGERPDPFAPPPPPPPPAGSEGYAASPPPAPPAPPAGVTPPAPPAGVTPPAPPAGVTPQAPGYGTPPPAAYAAPQQPSYGAYGQAPGYGYGGVVEHPQGTTVLIMGILSLVLCGVLGPFAWSMGNKALKEIDADPSRYSNRSTVNAGRICGIIATIFLGLAVIGFILFFLLVGVAGISSSRM